MLIELAILGGTAVLWGKLKRKNFILSSSTIQQINKKNQKPSFNRKKLIHDIKNAILGDERHQLQVSLDPEIQTRVERRKKEENRHLVLSMGAGGLVLLGTLWPAFFILGIAAVLYLARYAFWFSWKDLKKGHFFSIYLLTAIQTIGMIVTGHLVLAAIGGILGVFMIKLIKKAEENSQKHLINIFAGHPSQVWLKKDGGEIQVAFNTIAKGDIVIVHAGEIIPVDGIIQTGSASIDQHILTGESQPVERGIGDSVFAATLLLAGRISILVEVAGEETVAANIGNILNHTKNYKDELTIRGKKIADDLMPVELGISVITWPLLGPNSALAIMNSGLGYRMAMYGPMSVLNYLQIFSRKGILVKDGRVLESLSQVDTIVFDKTGTLTMEQPMIGNIYPLAHYDENQLLRYAAGAEYRQTHPIANAIIDRALEQGLTLPTPEQTNCEVGYGIKVQLEQKTVRVGSVRFMLREGLSLPNQLNDLQQQAKEQGYSLVYVGIDDELAGVLEMQPSIRPEAHQLIKDLKQRGLTTYIISGDHEQPTRNIAQQLGVDHYFAETLPAHKADLVKQLRDQGKFVCFVGDGINDAIALKSAQVSISLKGASSAATDTAQVIFMDGTLTPLNHLFQFSDEFEKVMQANYKISMIPGIINIGGIYLLHFSLVTSLIIFYGATLFGLVNILSPLIKHQDTQVNLPQNTEFSAKNDSEVSQVKLMLHETENLKVKNKVKNDVNVSI